MNTPMNALVSDMVNLLDESLREDFEERAGIIEFDAELPRDHAECLALLDVLHRHPSALCGATLLQVKLKNSVYMGLTTDIDHARLYLKNIGGVEIAFLNLKNVIDHQFEGICRIDIAHF
ncbi:hypothetical protein [Nitrosomonas ureae]|uniref:Uncharacterized protein n=1 Tax=Nitrosomonas ureae TaxID=44577 RepID=A0A2T5I624_9PROT|nr:hypothetical protein [Nitrosomonas ureae]PTQ79279.1 hypothetical protein C8R28_105311 [Nitrosomonas ureae]